EKQGMLGYFADENGFEKVAGDMLAITEQIKNDHPGIPVILFGHSMGSFLARHYIQQHSDLIDGVILSGTGYYARFLTDAASQIAAKLPPARQSDMMNTLVFSSFNRKVPDKKTNVDWLTRDDRFIHNYMNDPYCGFIPTAGFFKDLMTGLSIIHNPKNNRQIRSDLPMLIISGTEDPVGDYTRGVWKTAALYHQADLENIKIMLL